MIGSEETGRVGFVEEEGVEERVERRGEVRGPLAVLVSADLLEPVVLGYAEGLPDGVRGCHAAEGAEGAEPLKVGVLVRDHSAGRDHGGEEVVVVREGVDGVDKVVEVGREPDVLGHDLRRLLHHLPAVFFELGQTPACVSARAGFLWDGQRDAWFEGTCHQCAFAVSRASRDGDLLCVDVRRGSLFQCVDDAADTPDPSGHGTRCSGTAVQVEEQSLSSAACVVLLGHVRVFKNQSSNLGYKHTSIRGGLIDGETRSLRLSGRGD